MKAISIGGAMVDTIAIIENERIERMSMLNAETSFLLLEEGRKTEALEISTHCGGGAINTAVAMARLGFDVSALVKLGRDARADLILAKLSSEGVATGRVIRDAQAPTGASVIVSSHERNAAVFTFRGANTLLAPDELIDDAFAADLVYVSALSSRSVDCYPSIVEKAKAAGALVAVNAGVRQLSADPDAFLGSLPKIDILALNRAEAEVLVPSLVARFGEGGSVPAAERGEQIPQMLARGLSARGFEMSVPAFLQALRAVGVRYAMLTDGVRGSFVGSDAGMVHCPAVATAVASTAGAGDAMASTFAAFIALGRPADVALKAATLNAASVVAYIDTQTGLLRREALEGRLAARSDLRPQHWKL